MDTPPNTPAPTYSRIELTPEEVSAFLEGEGCNELDMRLEEALEKVEPGKPQTITIVISC